MHPKTKTKAAALIAMVNETIADNPIEYEGFTWAAYRQEGVAADLEMSVATLRRMISKPPFARERCNIEGEVWSLLRILAPGETPPEKTPKHIARIMQVIWKEKTGREVSHREFGCLCGLAKVWPAGCQTDIFKTALDNWSGYKVGVNFLLDGLKAKGEKVEIKFHKFPTILTMRRFPEAGVELHGMKLQCEGKPLPPALAEAYYAQHIGG